MASAESMDNLFELNNIYFCATLKLGKNRIDLKLKVKLELGLCILVYTCGCRGYVAAPLITGDAPISRVKW